MIMWINSYLLDTMGNFFQDNIKFMNVCYMNYHCVKLFEKNEGFDKTQTVH